MRNAGGRPLPGCHHDCLLSGVDGETVRDRPLILTFFHLRAGEEGSVTRSGAGGTRACGRTQVPTKPTPTLRGVTGDTRDPRAMAPAAQVGKLRAMGTQLLTGGSSTIS